MLFDIRGRRRNVVKVVYVVLALLLGGGLVLFGIGGDTSGGLVDAITNQSGGDTSDDRFAKREAAALAKTKATPSAAPAWAELARARFQLAGQGEFFDAEKGTFSEKGNAKLRGAKQAWEKYLSLEPDPPDERLARLMVQAFDALGDAEGAARAQEVVAEANPENANVYAQLAALSYAAGLTRKGDLAKDKALELTEPDMREALKGQLESAKAQGAVQAIQSPTGG
jgi:tetratricopeptide (TPR) repeat protein